MKNAVPSEICREVETFFYAEARMLEDNRFDEWLTCFTDDVRYWMPVRENVPTTHTEESDRFSLFDDDKKSLELRVLRIKTGQAHAEIPPSTTLRTITNVMAMPAAQDADSSLNAFCNFMVYQERRGQHGVTFYGRRTDLLRRSGGEWKIAHRRIDLAQMVLPTTISIFF